MTAPATVAWVLGSAGLLGAALCRSLRADGTELFRPAQRFSWAEPAALAEQMQTAVAAFGLHAQDSQRWEIHWAAGVGTMGSTAETLAPETQALTLMLTLMDGQAWVKSTPGTILFASSAGAIYAGSADEVITEHTAPCPTTAYAAEKLKQEDLVRRFVAANLSTNALIARISTLYGAGQANGKKQGLLGYISRSIIRNQPVQIYVPFDTIRDYIDADDAARAMLGSARDAGPQSGVLLKIIASETPATIAEIISIFKRLSRRTPLVVRSANKLSSLYTRRVQFKSIVSSAHVKLPGKRLPVGISELMRAEHLAFVKSPSPSLTTPLKTPLQTTLKNTL
jgi:UDP-glucose 4-epimerase